MEKKLLLISYYFPPCGGAPVQRWHRFLPQLTQAGWQPIVLTIQQGDYPYTDHSLLQELPPQLKVVRTPAPALNRFWKAVFGKNSELPHGSLATSKSDPPLMRLFVWIRLNLIIPDLRVFWIPSAYKHAQKNIKKHGIRIVITNAPPHSSHLIGMMLQKKLGVKWIADWRDPWTGIHYLSLKPPNPITMWLHKKLEKKVCEKADLNLLVSEHLKSQLPPGKKLVIRNGFDMEAVMQAKKDAHPAGEFRISYVGQITAGQDLSALAHTLATIAGKDKVRISFIGTRLAWSQQKMLAEKLGSAIEILPFIPHQQALQEMAASQLLVMLINRYAGFEGMLTTKLYEYLGMRVPVLCIGPLGGEAEKLIRQYQAGLCVDTDDLAKAQSWMEELYQAYLSGESGCVDSDVSGLSSGFQSRLLIRALEQFCTAKPAPQA